VIDVPSPDRPNLLPPYLVSELIWPSHYFKKGYSRQEMIVGIAN
jgi:hypothetical protein